MKKFTRGKILIVQKRLKETIKLGLVSLFTNPDSRSFFHITYLIVCKQDVIT